MKKRKDKKRWQIPTSTRFFSSPNFLFTPLPFSFFRVTLLYILPFTSPSLLLIIPTLIPPTHSPFFSFLITTYLSPTATPISSSLHAVTLSHCVSCHSLTSPPHSTYTLTDTERHTGRQTQTLKITVTNGNKGQEKRKCPQTPSIFQRSSQELANSFPSGYLKEIPVMEQQLLSVSNPKPSSIAPSSQNSGTKPSPPSSGTPTFPSTWAIMPTPPTLTTPLTAIM